MRTSLLAAEEKGKSQAQQIERQSQQIDALKAVLAQKRQALSKLEAFASDAAPAAPAKSAQMQIVASMSATILSEMQEVEKQVLEFHAATEDADAQFARAVARLRLVETSSGKSDEAVEGLTEELKSLYHALEDRHVEMQGLQEENQIVHERARNVQQQLGSALQLLEDAKMGDDDAARTSAERIRALESSLEEAHARIRHLSLDRSSASPPPLPHIYASTDSSTSLKPGAVGREIEPGTMRACVFWSRLYRYYVCVSICAITRLFFTFIFFCARAARCSTARPK